MDCEGCIFTEISIRLDSKQHVDVSIDQFDKYGEDSMKRPLQNQFTSQIAYPVIILNTFTTPFWGWRIYFSPLNPVLAKLVAIITSFCIIWVMLSLIEALHIGANLILGNDLQFC